MNINKRPSVNAFIWTLFASAVLCVKGVSAADDPTGESKRQFNSGVKRVQLFELYTSEGCSSCPSADRWFSQLKSDPGVWKNFIPVTFHVDYWDYLGWKDIYASKENTRRQSRYEIDGNTKGVYTPGFVLAGKEWKNWFSIRPSGGPVASQESVGELSASFNGDKFEASFSATSELDDSYTLNIALLGFDLSSDVKSGENSGSDLKHDFVVLEMAAFPENGGAKNTWSGVFEPLKDKQKANDLGLVLWVSKKGSQTPIQAVGNYL